MRDLPRFYPPDLKVMKGINLSFCPGATIGILGDNGSGKSSVHFHDPGLNLNSLMAGTTCDFVHPASTSSRVSSPSSRKPGWPAARSPVRGSSLGIRPTWRARPWPASAQTIRPCSSRPRSVQPRPTRRGASAHQRGGVLELVLQDCSEAGRGVYPAPHQLVHQQCGEHRVLISLFGGEGLWG